LVFTPTDLYGMFQIKVWTIPFQLLRVVSVNEGFMIISTVFRHL